jgi:hypothetical protein
VNGQFKQSWGFDLINGKMCPCPYNSVELDETETFLPAASGLIRIRNSSAFKGGIKIVSKMLENIHENPPISQKRGMRLEIRLTEAEYARLKTASEAYGTVSDYVRHSCLTNGDMVMASSTVSSPQSRQMQKETLDELRKLNMQLQKVGVNLNQTSKHIHFLERHGLGDVGVIGRLNHNYIQVQSTVIACDKSLRDLIQKLTKR